MRRRGTCTSKTPTNWRNFLRDDDNKTELLYELNLAAVAVGGNDSSLKIGDLEIIFFPI